MHNPGRDASLQPSRTFRRTAVVLGGLAVLAAVSLASGKADDAPNEEGFVPLFDGQSLDGWVVMGKPQGWKIVDGVIHSDGAQGGEWLRSEKEYGDFILKAEWRVSKNGNSGVFIRSTRAGRPWLTGYEVQISNEPRDDEHCTGSLYGYAAVNPRPDESYDQWHTFEIHCVGPRIRVLSDGKQCVEFDQSTNEKTKDKPRRGYIGLQDSHSPEGHSIEYRNIRIKPLD